MNTRLKHPDLTLARATLFFQRLCGKLLAESVPVRMQIAGPVGRIPFAEAQRLDYREARLGEDLGPTWSTHWLRVSGEIPGHWKGRTVLFRFRSGSEALVWLGGVPFHGLNHEDDAIFLDGGRAEVVLPAAVAASGRFEAEVESACNGLWGREDEPPTPRTIRYKLYEACLALRNDEAWRLAHDLVIPVRWLEEIPGMKIGQPWLPDSAVSPTTKNLPPWPGEVLRLLNLFCNVCDTEDPATWEEGRAVLARIFACRNATFAHEITAVGHAHIDTAWLWPLAETRRKCARSFSTALHIMEQHPSFRFACSQAQQHAWMQTEYPALYARIKEAAARGQWLPVGGTWVEPDCNVPSGESLVRQFLVGQRFFRREFGVTCREFWNPDVFGYSGALPQILRGVGIEFFLTQKLSWNQFNKPHHASFLWEGIDGSRVLTHFPPANTYNALDGGNLIRHFNQHEQLARDNDRTSIGLMLFGFGDGGGGATHHMMEVIDRLGDVQGFPRVKTGTPAAFFERLAAEMDEAPVTVGELYLEFHRGTYTTAAANKRDNRRCELALRDVEMLAAVAARGGRGKYPHESLTAVWRTVLLNQFHDILPGSSIREVYEDSARDYADCLHQLRQLREKALSAAIPALKCDGSTVVNTLGWERAGIVQRADGTQALVTCPACGFAPLVPREPGHGKAGAREADGQLILENGLLRAVFDACGRLIGLRDLVADREVVPPGEMGNHFRLFEDYPHAWDAWEIDPSHLEKAENLTASSARIVEEGGLRASLAFEYAFGASSLCCRVALEADSPLLQFSCELDWRHRHRFLKVEFPVAVHSPEAAFEIQFGHVRRPTHFNSSLDIARFESPAHFWTDLSEEGYGVALLNDSKYGHAVHGHVLRLSLVRGSTAPDPEADQGHHTFAYALFPHQGTLAEAGVVRRAREFNTPLTVTQGRVSDSCSWFSTDSPHLVIDTVKIAEDSDALIVRLYECHGARGRATLRTSLPFSSVARVNLLEENPEPIEEALNGTVPLTYRPFEIITLRCASSG